MLSWGEFAAIPLAVGALNSRGNLEQILSISYTYTRLSLRI